MHGLAITQSVVDMVVERTAGRRVASVHIQVGRLSGVVPDAMTFCYDVAVSGTPPEGTTLEIEQTGGQGSCRTCGGEFALEDLILLCPCGSADVQIVTGQELRVTSVRMVVEPCA